jgi:hypothetical protein
MPMKINSMCEASLFEVSLHRNSWFRRNVEWFVKETLPGTSIKTNSSNPNRYLE